MNSLLACLIGSARQQPTFKATPRADTHATIDNVLKVTITRRGGSGIGILDLFPLFWSYVHGRDRRSLRLCCREGRRVHDSLVTNVYLCDEDIVLSEVPPARLPRSPLPTCHETAAEACRALRGVVSRGCHPHVLLLCLTNGSERQRHEQG